MRRGQVVALGVLAAIPLGVVAYLALLVVAVPTLRVGDERRAEGIALAAAVALGERGRGDDATRAAAAYAEAIAVGRQAFVLRRHGGVVVVTLYDAERALRVRLVGTPLRIPRGAVAAARPIRTQDGGVGAVLVPAPSASAMIGSGASLR
jgi:hypothetical protein